MRLSIINLTSLSIMSAAFIACAKTASVSDNNGPAIPGLSALERLNQVADQPNASLEIHINPVLDVSVQELPSYPPPPPVPPPPPEPPTPCGPYVTNNTEGAFTCPSPSPVPVDAKAEDLARPCCPVGGGCLPSVPACTPPPAPSLPNAVAVISGAGSITNPIVESLTVALLFDPSIEKGEACLQLAEDALIHQRSFIITGESTLVPVDLQNASALAQATVIQGLASQALQVNAGTVSPVVLTNLWVGVWFTSIASCSLGDAVTQPVPVPYTNPPPSAMVGNSSTAP